MVAEFTFKGVLNIFSITVLAVLRCFLHHVSHKMVVVNGLGYLHFKTVFVGKQWHSPCNFFIILQVFFVDGEFHGYRKIAAKIR